MPRPRIFQFSCSNSCHFDGLSVVRRLLSAVGCLMAPVAPGTGMRTVNISAAQYIQHKGDVVSFLTAAEFVACLIGPWGSGVDIWAT